MKRSSLTNSEMIVQLQRRRNDRNTVQVVVVHVGQGECDDDVGVW